MEVRLLTILVVEILSIFIIHKVNAVTDPVFNTYIDFYEKEYNRKVTDIPIKFSKLEGTEVGNCIIRFNTWKEINIKKEYWDWASDKERLFLIIHELGHCDMLKEHNNILLSDGCYGSIMNQTVSNRSCVEKHYRYLLDEMRR